ncbi:MAG: hypothetical protein AAF298_28840 [Cyanobacteria bacterium P01_A01_bin.40]
MVYQLETTSQLYGDQQYLAHRIKGEISADDRYLFGQRVPSYGIINFGAMAAGSTKNFTPIANGIQSDIELKSIFDFTSSATNDECTFKLFSGEIEILEQKIVNNDMPYTFPPGAIINPNLTIQVKPRYTTTQLLIYWQPVHVLNYVEVQ